MFTLPIQRVQAKASVATRPRVDFFIDSTNETMTGCRLSQEEAKRVVGEVQLVLHEWFQKLSPFTLGSTDFALHLT
jgi:hypothetical protein